MFNKSRVASRVAEVRDVSFFELLFWTLGGVALLIFLVRVDAIGVGEHILKLAGVEPAQQEEVKTVVVREEVVSPPVKPEGAEQSHNVASQHVESTGVEANETPQQVVVERAVVSDTQTTWPVTYRVVRGDTYWSIVRRFYGDRYASLETTQKLAHYNGRLGMYPKLIAGTVLVLPSPDELVRVALPPAAGARDDVRAGIQADTPDETDETDAPAAVEVDPVSDYREDVTDTSFSPGLQVGRVTGEYNPNLCPSGVVGIKTVQIGNGGVCP